jgi:hypothetical protein
MAAIDYCERQGAGMTNSKKGHDRDQIAWNLLFVFIVLIVIVIFGYSVVEVVKLFHRLPEPVRVFLGGMLSASFEFVCLLFVILGEYPVVSLSLIFVLLVVWTVLRHTPTELEYYRTEDGGISLSDPTSELVSWAPSPLPKYVYGRRNVYRFCISHNIDLDYVQRILGSFKRLITDIVHHFLGLLFIPNPRRYPAYRYALGLFEYTCYPLGDSRQQYLLKCFRFRTMPWKNEDSIKQVIGKVNYF